MKNLQDVREAGLKSLEEEGDHVYVKPTARQDFCSYTDPNGNPSCIVGHIIYRTTPELLDVINVEEWGSKEHPHKLESFTAQGLGRRNYGEGYTPAAIGWLSTAQDYQDQGGLWSVAIEAADKYITDCLPGKDYLTTEETEYVATWAPTTEGEQA